MKRQEKITIFWFRRDLRLIDNHALSKALELPFPVLPIFIFDTEITKHLQQEDARINFIYNELSKIHTDLNKHRSSLLCLYGEPTEVWQKLIKDYDIHSVFSNEDYEPYAIQRDKKIQQLLQNNGISYTQCKDQVIFQKNEVLKKDGKPYTVFTPYKKKWLEQLKEETILEYSVAKWQKFLKVEFKFPNLEELGFKSSNIKVKPFTLEYLNNYKEHRNYPALDETSYLSPHLRFGTVSIRNIFKAAIEHETFVSELIWREFFMQILFHFPLVVSQNFNRKYDGLKWRNNAQEFERWTKGETGYPIVDAGMRELNATGYMHNRVRMITAGFLCKHLLVDWRWGEAYFAKKLLDFELSSNNGNWQWSAGTGCDAAPYFRVFNPIEQIKKFDSNHKYINKWIPNLNSLSYPNPMVEHKFARERAINTYKAALGKA